MKTQSFRPKFIKALFIGALAIFSISCSKTTEKIGNGLLPEGDNIGVFFTDSVVMTCHSQTIDTMATKGMTTVLLGSMMDPVMGLTNANIFTQLHLSSTNQHFGSDPVIDSVVLQLSLTGYYGDTTTLQTVHVYELADSLNSNSLYYQFSEVADKGIDLANGYQFYPHPRTPLSVSGNDTINQPTIRIPLLNSLGEQLASADSMVYKTPDAFKRFFYGLKICCESVNENGAICYLNPTSNTVTQLKIYYRETPGAETQMRYDFYITSDDIYFNQYQHDYSLGSTDFVQQVINGDTLMGLQQLFLQSMGGVRSFITFPGFAEWANGLVEEGTHLIINEAKLILPASAILEDSTFLTPPTSLALLNLKTDGNTIVLPDYLEGSSYYGGSYSHAKKSVTFRISEYLQKVIQNPDYSQGLYLSITGASFNANRWIIAGPEADQENKMKCEIKYSILRE
ncbi:MAG: DUF4270 family protein [Bacteroidales bacterium]|nr:DUF4270 family protein [Bacteroidales bacterium]